jgi:ATP-dependent Lon protease
MQTSNEGAPSSGDHTVSEGEVDSAAEAAFKSWLVSKPRARRFASQHSVPHHLAESLIASYRLNTSSGKEAARKARQLLSNLLARAEDIELLKMEASNEGSVQVIDHVGGEFDSGRGEPVISFSGLGLTKVPIEKAIAEEHPRLLKEGFYAVVQLDYEDRKGSDSPFRAGDLEPLEPSGTDLLPRLEAGRKSFSDRAWLYFLVRSVGLAAPSEEISPRTAALSLVRLVPLVEKRYSLLELGPRQTGKTYLYEELTPHAYVLSSGTATEAQLFVHAGSGEAGLVAQHDAVCFDETTTARSGTGDTVSALKGYLSSGAARRGKQEVQGQASIVMLGNIDQPAEEVLQKDGHLFAPLPPALGEDTALMDRISACVPGWEVPKLGPQHLASGLGLASDVLAECLKELCERNYTPEIKHRLSLEGNLTGRDRRAVWQTISGLVKLIYPSPDGVSSEKVSDEVLRWAAWLGLEMRLRVRAQQHRLQPEEFEEGEFGFRIEDTDRITPVRLQEDQK